MGHPVNKTTGAPFAPSPENPLLLKDMATHFDMIVIGAGHAGCEAALAGARMGLTVCLFTLNLDTIGHMSCNPAIGGLAKGHLVREIDALGGEMAKTSDRAAIQTRMLNLSKGPAVRSLRAQADRVLYKNAMRKSVEGQKNLFIKQSMVDKLIVQDGKVTGTADTLGIFYKAKAVVVTTGTFLKGLMHIGLEKFEAGRAGEFPSVGLSDSLRSLGLPMGRLKTGTPPRLDANSIDFSKCVPQHGDDPPTPFSYSTKEITNPQLPCFITYTTERTKKIILDNLDRSPLYSGKIKGVGPRYCPSVEDKVVRFSHRERHQVFLEPEGIETSEYYANGISTSLPLDVQAALVRSIPGLEEAEIMRPGYAIEYDFVKPTSLRPTLETKKIGGLFLAGQINGTSGYEEAAAQGLVAGINAVFKIKGQSPLVLERHEAYTGVLIDDLITKGTLEPYRMFTSRAEYRLLLRHDNADLRLMDRGRSIGLVQDEAFARFTEKRAMLKGELRRLKETKVRPDEANSALIAAGTSTISEGTSLIKLLKRPEVTYEMIRELSPPPVGFTEDAAEVVQTEIKYEGYIKRQKEKAEKLKRSALRPIPGDFDYRSLSGLSNEILEKLLEVRPETIAQAGRIPGVTPAALTLIMIATLKASRTPGS